MQSGQFEWGNLNVKGLMQFDPIQVAESISELCACVRNVHIMEGQQVCKKM